MTRATCFECDTTEHIHHHHVVPRSLGGTRTIPLCERCHGLVHSKQFTTVGALTSKAMGAMKAAGKYTGGRAPFGRMVADDGVTLTDCPAEQATIAEARRLREQGLSRRAIVAELAAQGMTTRNGRMFDHKAIPTLLAAQPTTPIPAKSEATP
jgi:hypothetical protein